MQVTVNGSNAQIVIVRNQSIAAGGFFPIATFYAKDGIKRVTAGFQSPDAAFTNVFYVSKEPESGAQYATTAGAASSKNKGEMTSVEVTTGKTVVYFNNTDAAAHPINADAIGWAN